MCCPGREKEEAGGGRAGVLMPKDALHGRGAGGTGAGQPAPAPARPRAQRTRPTHRAGRRASGRARRRDKQWQAGGRGTWIDCPAIKRARPQPGEARLEGGEERGRGGGRKRDRQTERERERERERRACTSHRTASRLVQAIRPCDHPAIRPFAHLAPRRIRRSTRPPIRPPAAAAAHLSPAHARRRASPARGSSPVPAVGEEREQGTARQGPADGRQGSCGHVGRRIDGRGARVGVRRDAQ